jgi:hypothetical protein
MTSETMTKNGKYWSDRKWEKLNQPIFFGYLLFQGDQKKFDWQINGEDQPCHWLDDWKLVW